MWWLLSGGVGALSTLVSTLNKSFPAPLVLAQHLDPQRPRHLASILERRSTLPIVIVSEHEPTLLQSGKIYVVPANRHVKIVDGHVNLEHDQNDRPKPSVDLLLSSAAQSYGEHLIAVILTGSGSDGAAGAVDVKKADEVQSKKRLEAVQHEHTELVNELSAANKRFGTMNKELQDANEELQATNEELETNNEELQATNEELQTTNDELSARTIELQELSSTAWSNYNSLPFWNAFQITSWS